MDNGCLPPSWSFPSSSSSNSTTICSGHGTCVDSTAFSTRFSQLCLCEDSFNGAGDYFLTNVAVDSATRRPLSIGCTNSTLGTAIGWSVLLACFVIRETAFVVALQRTIARRGLPSMEHGVMSFLKSYFSRMPYRVMTVEALVATPFYMTVASLKVAGAYSGTNVLGADAGVSVIYVLAFSISIVFYNDFTSSQFKSIAVSRKMASAQSFQLARHHRLVGQFIFAFYFVLNLIPVLIMLGLDKSRGPIASGEVTLLIIRNVGVLVWQVLQYFGNYWLKRETQLLLSSLSISPLPGVEDSGKEVRRSARGVETDARPISLSSPRAGTDPAHAPLAIVQFLNDSQNTIRKGVVWTFICYAIATIPQFWPYQQYATILAVAPATFTTCQAFIFLRMPVGQGRNNEGNSSRSRGGQLDSNNNGARKRVEPRGEASVLASGGEL